MQRTKPRARFTLLAVAVWATALPFAGHAADNRPQTRRVLITNDNGIDDPKIVALARAFAAHAETWVVAPSEDRSGSGSHLLLPRVGHLAVAERELGPGIRAFAVDGLPGDCVLIALAGLMRDRPPDLVISGINGGANLGADWMFSGTVGAARVAALGGIPAIAVSGLDDDLPGAVAAAVDWVVRLADHQVVRGLAPGTYLTASLPRRPPHQIAGVRVADRAPIRRYPQLAADAEGAIWRIVGMEEVGVPPHSVSDEARYDANMIVVVPMHADEVDGTQLLRWLRADPQLPAWLPAVPAKD